MIDQTPPEEEVLLSRSRWDIYVSFLEGIEKKKGRKQCTSKKITSEKKITAIKCHIWWKCSFVNNSFELYKTWKKTSWKLRALFLSGILYPTPLPIDHLQEWNWGFGCDAYCPDLSILLVPSSERSHLWASKLVAKTVLICIILTIYKSNSNSTTSQTSFKHVQLRVMSHVIHFFSPLHDDLPSW